MPKPSGASTSERIAESLAAASGLYNQAVPVLEEMPPEWMRRSLHPIEMAALITATVEFWKFRVQRDGPFGSDFPKIADVAGELYASIAYIPAEQGAPTAVLSSTESDELDPQVLAAALNATVEIWKLSLEQPFAGYRASIATRAPIEVIAKQVRSVIEILTKPIAA